MTQEIITLYEDSSGLTCRPSQITVKLYISLFRAAIIQKDKKRRVLGVHPLQRVMCRNNGGFGTRCPSSADLAGQLYIQYCIYCQLPCDLAPVTT